MATSLDTTPVSDLGHGADITRRQLRGSSMLLAGQGLALAINFLPHVLLVRYLTTADYGIWAYALTLTSVCQTFALSFSESMVRFVTIHHERRERNELVGTILLVCGVTLAIGMACIVGLYAAPDQMLQLLSKGKEPVSLLRIMILLVPMEAMSVLLMNLFACFARPTAILVSRYVLDPALKFLVVLLAIGLHKNLTFLACGRVLAAVVIVLAYGAVMLVEMRRDSLFESLKFSQLRAPVRDICIFAIPQFTSNILSILEGTTIVLVLGYFHDMTQVAMYRVVIPAATLNDIVMTAFTLLYMPAAARLFANHNYQGMNFLYWRTAAWISVLSFPIFIMTFCFAGPLTVLLYGKRYASSAVLLAVISLGHYFNSVLGLNGMTLRVLGRIRYIVVVNVAASVILVVLSLLLVPRYGAIGAAVASGGTIVLHTILKQIGMGMMAGFSMFDKHYLPLYGLVFYSTVGVIVVKIIAPQTFPLQLLISAVATIFVALCAKKNLDITSAFPEMRKVPLIGKLLA